MTLGSHQRAVGASQNHLTPRWIIDALGPFDMDPCAASPRPWDCARVNISSGGLEHEWRGRIWLNPPFDRYQVGRWVRKLADHNQGTTLLHARTEAAWFEPIWESASAILFMADRLKFCFPDGSPQPANSGAPAILAAFGNEDAKKLRASGIAGALVTEWDWDSWRVA